MYPTHVNPNLATAAYNPSYSGTVYLGPEYANPVLAPTVLPMYSPDVQTFPTATVQSGTVICPQNYNRQPTTWAHPSSQSCAAAYLSHDEVWPRIAPGGAGLRRKHLPIKRSDEKGHTAAGAYQPAFEAPAARLPKWQPPVGLPPSVAHLYERFRIDPIQPYITPQCLPHQF